MEDCSVAEDVCYRRDGLALVLGVYHVCDRCHGGRITIRHDDNFVYSKRALKA
jgi:hypothetical protein